MTPLTPYRAPNCEELVLCTNFSKCMHWSEYTLTVRLGHFHDCCLTCYLMGLCRHCRHVCCIALSSPPLSHFLFRTILRWLHHLTSSRDKCRHVSFMYILVCLLWGFDRHHFKRYQGWFSSVYSFWKKKYTAYFLFPYMFVYLKVWNIFHFCLWFYFIYLFTLYLVVCPMESWLVSLFFCFLYFFSLNEEVWKRNSHKALN